MSSDSRFFSVSALRLRLLPGDLGDQLLFGERLVGFGLHLGLLKLGFERRDLRLLGQKLVLKLHAQVLERGLGGLQRQPRVDALPARPADCSIPG